MIELNVMDDCLLEGSTYSHESEVCTSNKCLRCDDGEWRVIAAPEREKDFFDWL